MSTRNHHQPNFRMSVGRLAIPVLIALAQVSTAVGADFVINFRSLGSPDNPHPPIPQCQVTEQDDPPFPDSTGDCLHGLSTSNGQPFECIEAGIDDCPALTIGAPSPGLMYATVEGLGIVDYDTQDPGACPLHCSSNWLIGENCGITPGDPCFCDYNGCVGTPTPHEDYKDGLDFTHIDGPANEEFRIYFGVPTLLSELAFWRAGFSELSIKRSDCPVPVIINYREGASGLQSGDGVFTFPGGGLYLPQNASVTISNPGFRPFSTSDRIAMQELGVTRVVSADQEPWRRGCPFFAVPFDRGLSTILTDQWTVTDDDPSPPIDVWRSTDNIGATNCGLGNLTGGAAGAVCFQSEPGRSGFDTSLISRSIDLSAAAAPVLRFVTAFQRDDEVLEVSTSTDGGVTWNLQVSLTQNLPATPGTGGAAVLVPLSSVAGEADVRLRFRYRDPNHTDSPSDYAVIDDILIFSDESGIFADGFESGSTSAWSSP